MDNQVSQQEELPHTVIRLIHQMDQVTPNHQATTIKTLSDYYSRLLTKYENEYQNETSALATVLSNDMKSHLGLSPNDPLPSIMEAFKTRITSDPNQRILLDYISSRLGSSSSKPIQSPMVKTVYVAGAFVDKETVNRVQRLASKKGWSITHDWTVTEKPPTLQPTSEILKTYGENDLSGVKEANLVIAVFNDPTYKYQGTFTEVGIALGLNKRVIALCVKPISTEQQPNSYKRNPFFWLPQIERIEVGCGSIKEALGPILDKQITIEDSKQKVGEKDT